MISTFKYNQSKQRFSKTHKNKFNLSLLAASKLSLVSATALGKNLQASPDLFNDPGIQQSTWLNNSLRALLEHFVLPGLALLLFSGNLFAGSANLAWDASKSSNVGGYKMSYGQSSGHYTSSIDVGKTTTYKVSGLQEGAKYFFAVKAYNLARTGESAYSNEANLTIPVTTALTAFFTPASPITVVQGKPVTFTPITTGTVTSWKWSFSGASITSVTNSTAQAVNVTYSTSGTKSVSLTATGPSGNSVTTTKLITVTVATTASSSTNAIVKAPIPASSNGLVAAYGFEEASGMAVADASGKGNHGTIMEAVRITNGHKGKALKFDGVNDWVTVNNSASLALSAGMTLEAWVYPQSQTTGGKTVILKEGSGTEVYSLYANEDANLPVSYINNGSYRGVYAPAKLPVNQWTHLVATYDGQYQRLYVGGVEVAKNIQSGLIQQSAGVLRIGGNSLWGEFLNGYIDELRIYNRALPATEVRGNLATAISVTNPQKFVMGNQTIEPWIDSRPQGTAEAFQTVPKKSGVVTTVLVYLDASSTATELVAGIYKNNNGHPGALVTQGKLNTLKRGAWNPVSIPVAFVTAAQPYWIAILGSKGQIRFRDRVGSGTGLMETSASSLLTSLPLTWSRRSFKTNSSMSVFANGY